jgi:hypothetical protein
VPGQQHVTGDAGPHQAHDGAGAVRGVHARPAGLHQRGPQLGQRAEVELTVGVQPPGVGGPLRRQHPVAADDLARAVLAHDEVVAELIEPVDVQTGRGAV